MQEGIVNLCYCPTEKMITDLLTKSLPKERFKMLRDAMGMVELTSTQPVN